jgi:ribosomal protein S18 acetylase RimI-like enzyme
MRVRPASADDVPALARLNAEVQELHRAALPHHYRDAPLGEIEDWMRRLLGDPDVSILLADQEEDGGAVGFAVVRREDSPGNTFALPRVRAMVEGIGVAAAARRRGAGRALMAAAEDLARAWGATAVALDVQSFNEEAHRFYRKLGYTTATHRMSKRL